MVIVLKYVKVILNCTQKRTIFVIYTKSRNYIRVLENDFRKL